MGLRNAFEGYKAAKQELAEQDAPVLAKVREDKKQETGGFKKVVVDGLTEAESRSNKAYVKPHIAQGIVHAALGEPITETHQIVVRAAEEAAVQVPVAVEVPHV